MYGHPQPTLFIPQPNQIVKNSDSTTSDIIITFTERLELQASKIYVLDNKNKRIDNHDLRMGLSEKSLSITLDKSKLNSGKFTVKWMVLSKDYAFITKGSYTFSIA